MPPASIASAREAEWVNNLASVSVSESETKTDTKREVSALERAMLDLENLTYKKDNVIYKLGTMKPEDLVKKGFTQPDMKTVGTQIGLIMVRLRSQLEKSLLKDLVSSRKMGAMLARLPAQYQMQATQKTLNDVAAKQNEILEEMKDAETYWKRVAGDGKLPWMLLKDFNGKTISWPFLALRKKEMDILQDLSSVR